MKKPSHAGPCSVAELVERALARRRAHAAERKRQRAPDPARPGAERLLPDRWTRSRTTLWALALAAVGAMWCTLGAAWPLDSEARAGAQLMLRALPVDQAPKIDGKIESLWQAAPASLVEMRRGRQGEETSLTLDLRAVYTADHIYFMAQWPEAAPTTDDWGDRNRLIMHFSVAPPWEGAADLMCLTACHTAYVDQDRQARYVSAETIPPGLTDPLPVGGGWHDGVWTFEWGRPLVSGNPFDVQFDDLDGEHTVFCKIVEGVSNVADPVSDDMLLVFLNEQ